MTATARNSILERLTQIAAIGAFLLLVAGGTWGAVSGAFGGVMFGNQVREANLTATLQDLQSAVQALKSRIEQMPRPSDYVAQGQHLDRIDGRLDELGSRMTHDEIGAAADHARIDRLEAGAPPIRIPR